MAKVRSLGASYGRGGFTGGSDPLVGGQPVAEPLGTPMLVANEPEEERCTEASLLTKPLLSNTTRGGSSLLMCDDPMRILEAAGEDGASVSSTAGEGQGRPDRPAGWWSVEDLLARRTASIEELFVSRSLSLEQRRVANLQPTADKPLNNLN